MVEESRSEAEWTARRRRTLIGLYALVTFLFWASQYLYVPTLPTYTKTKTDSLALVGLVLSQYGLWQAVTRFPLGIAADWIGRRKPFILTGMILAGLGALTMATAGSVRGLALGRAITGVAASTWVPLTVVFSSLFPAEEAVRATAILTAVGSSGRIVATSVTGSLNQVGGYSLPFFLAVAVAALAAIALLPAREETRPRRQPSLGSLGRLIVRRDVLLPSLLAAVSQYATWAIPLGFLPILAKQMGATDVTQSALVSLHIVVMTMGSLVAATIVKRTGPQKLVLGCFVLLSAGIVGAVLARGLSMLTFAQVCVGLAHGVSYPVLMGMSIEKVVDAERATAMGLHQAVYAAGMFAGPWLSGLLAEALGIQPMFGITALGCLAVGLFLVRLLPAQRAGSQTNELPQVR